MGRFGPPEDDDDNDNVNYFHVQHNCSSSEEEREDEQHSQGSDSNNYNWGPLVQFRQHTPQNNHFGVEEEAEQEMEWPLPSQRYRIRPPSVTITAPRRRQRDDDGAMEEYAQEDYYDYDDPPKPRPLWVRFCMVALIAHLLARYGPAAPPQEANSDSWEDFWAREVKGLWRTTKLVGYTVPKYVGQWILLGLYDDVRYYYHQYKEYSQQQLAIQKWANCSLTHVEEWNLQYQQEPSDVYRIVGQSRAVEMTTQALDAWSQTIPLLLYFSGSRGVGKLELARQISQRAFSHCTTTFDTNNKEKNGDLWKTKSPVMMLQGRDFSGSRTSQERGEEDPEEEILESSTTSAAQSSLRVMRVQLYEMILRHVQTFPQGSIVILQHVEDMAEGLLATLVQDLAHTSPGMLHNNNRPEEMESYDIPALTSRLQEACKKTIFVMTSTVGSKTIASSIRHYEGIDQIPPLEFDLLMMHEIDTAYVDETKNTPLEIGNKFHAVAPFYPLEQTSLEHILLQKVHQWNLQQQQSAPELPPLIIMRSALHSLLDSSHVEYLSMVKRSTQTPLLTFSSSGAQFLHEGNPRMNAWQAAVKRCLRQHKRKEQDDDIDEQQSIAEKDGEHSHGSWYAVLDSETPNQQGVLYLCPSQGDHVSFNLLYPPTTLSSCQELCRFPL